MEQFILELIGHIFRRNTNSKILKKWPKMIENSKKLVKIDRKWLKID